MPSDRAHSTETHRLKLQICEKSEQLNIGTHEYVAQQLNECAYELNKLQNKTEKIIEYFETFMNFNETGIFPEHCEFKETR